MSSSIDSGCCSCRDHHRESKASAKNSRFLDAMAYIPLHLSSILFATPWLHLLLALGDPLQHVQKIPLISLAHIITPAPTDDAAETQTLPSNNFSLKKFKPL
jgi:hypothetical protein